MHVDVVTGAHWLCNKTDNLVVTPNSVTRFEGTRCNFVTCGNGHGGSHLFPEDLGARGQFSTRNYDVICGIESDGQVGSLKHD